MSKSNPTFNARGEATNCFAYTTQNGSGCAALKDWYEPSRSNRCRKCVFFKPRSDHNRR